MKEGVTSGNDRLKNDDRRSYRAKEARREHSSVGLEHLPYKQRVGGSTPSAPTKSLSSSLERLFSLYHFPHRVVHESATSLYYASSKVW